MNNINGVEMVSVGMIFFPKPWFTYNKLACYKLVKGKGYEKLQKEI